MNPHRSTLVIAAVHVLPAEHACDFEYVARRLTNPNLLDSAVALAVFRLPLLAVPVGEGRRGGQIVVEDGGVAEAMAAALRGRSGFPKVRTRHACGRFAIEWGAAPPEGASATDLEHFFGLASPDAPSWEKKPSTPARHRLQCDPSGLAARCNTHVDLNHSCRIAPMSLTAAQRLRPDKP